MLDQAEVLIFLCAGNQNHYINGHWFNLRGTKKNKLADLMVCFYGDDDKVAQKYEYTSDIFVRQKGPKWQLVREVFLNYCSTHNLYEKYKYFWFPDDDVYITSYDLIRFIETCLEHQSDIEIAQPALIPFHYASTSNVIKHGMSSPRRGFVEVMAPLIRIDVFKQLIPVIQQEICKSGYGLDSWGEWFKTYLIDNSCMFHSKPVTYNFNEGYFGKYKIDPFRELHAIKNFLRETLGPSKNDDEVRH